MTEENDAVTRREVDQLIDANTGRSNANTEARRAEIANAELLREERWLAHERIHGLLADAVVLASENEEKAIGKALETGNLADSRARDALRTALNDHHHEHEVHDAAHAREHSFTASALSISDETTKAALGTALDDHHREHQVHEVAHSREHVATDLALSKAETATEKRFEGVNEFREQLRAQASTFVTRDIVEALTKEIDRRFTDTAKVSSERYESLKTSITNIEKGDVKQEGKSLGQGTVVAIIVGAVGFVGTLLGIIIVAANLLTN